MIALLCSFGDATDLIPRSVLFGNPEKTLVAISPDGERLAWLAPLAIADDGGTTRGVMNVWVAPRDRPGEARPVTADSGRGIRGFFWQMDSRHVLYGQDRDGDENWRLYQTDITTRATRDLTPFEGVRAETLGSHPDHPDELYILLNRRDARYHDLYRLYPGSARLDLVMENPGTISGWFEDNDYKLRAVQMQRPDGGSRILLRTNDEATTGFREAQWRVVQEWGPDETFGSVAGFSPAGELLLLSSTDANATRLVSIDLQNSRTTVLAEDPQYDVTSVMRHPRTRALEAVMFFRARRDWQVIEPGLEADFAALRQGRRGDLVIFSRDLADRFWTVIEVADNAPQYYYLYDRANRVVTRLFCDRPRLGHYPLATMEPVEFPARDGLMLHGYLSLPPGTDRAHARDLPLVLEVHGGPWSRDLWGYNPSTQWLANRGYAVLKINFRGSTGYGKEHLNAGDRQWGAKMLDDLIDGKRWAISQGFVDSRRVGIMGGSYGGYAVLTGMAFTPGEFACGISVVGPSNLITLFQSIPPYWEAEKMVFARRVGRFDEEEFLRARSPLFRADQIRAPLMIAQGANDPRVKQAESDRIVAAVRRRAGEVTYLLFPDEGHGFARPENRMKYYAAAERFLARHLGGRMEPATGDETWQTLLH